MHPALSHLQPYPFERLARLHRGVVPPAALAPISLSIGEPKHAPPPLLVQALIASLGALGTYPATAGLPEFRRSAAGWLDRRYALGGTLNPDTMLLPVNGTREALFAFAQALIDPAAGSLVAMPNPFYQIYEGAALLAGATPYFLDTIAANGFVPDLDAVPDDVWRRCALLYLCSPGNPTGAVVDHAYMARAIELADRFDFVIAADECYADIYLDEAATPAGFLGACHKLGRDGYQRVVVFHSLSKRSSVPGLRSGFVAGDASILERFRLYRTYHGCALPVHVQRASMAAWDDDVHPIEKRALYRAKFDAVLPLLAPALSVSRPAAGFYLWPEVGFDDETFARELYATQNVIVLPGSYLGRAGATGNPGRGRVRISLVAGLAECVTAAHRIRHYLETRPQ
ncbi:MAG: succinyldiaminopimelate transaminase [Opitutales bacterium]|nr:succinyldiaminopimelate transaminase [Opitutales bacterium]